jgi:malonyl-CoA O-methyltransferase
MPPTQLRTIADRFNRHSGSYDRHSRVQQSMAADLVGRLGTRHRAPRAILELGCGTGFLTELLVTRFPQTTVCAIDTADKMVEATSRRVSSSARLELAVADAEGFDAGRRFDLIVSNAAVQWFVDHAGFPAHLATLLEPGGATVHSTFGPRTFQELFETIAEVSSERGLKPAPRGLNLPTASVWEAWMKEAGFVDVTCTSELVRAGYADCWTFLRSVRAIGASNGSGGGRSAALLGEVARRYDGRYRDADGVYATYEVVTIEAVAPAPETSQ